MSNKRSMIVYQNWADMIRALSDEMAGKLAKAMFDYGFDGKEPENEVINAMLISMKYGINENESKYQAKRERMQKINEQRKQNRNDIDTKSTRSRNDIVRVTDTVTDTVTVTDTDTVTDTVLSKDNYIKKDSPTESRKKLIALVDDSDLSDPVKDSVKEWLEYKRQRKDKLTEVGFKKKLSEIRNKENEIGATRVIQTINLSMSNDWRGIIWDAVPVKQQKQPTNINEWMQA